jgi:hypothetical protein
VGWKKELEEGAKGEAKMRGKKENGSKGGREEEGHLFSSL